MGASAGTSRGQPAVTAVVLCALRVEYLAMRAHLANLRQQEHPAGTRFEVGDLPGASAQVALAVTGPGTVGAGIIAQQAIGLFRPDLLMCVGVAGALSEDLQLGDVVLATRVDAYHGGRAAEDFLARPRTWDAPYRHEQVARHLDISGAWQRWLPAELAGTPPSVRFGPIAAGEVVLDSRASQLFSHLRLHYNDAVAIDMEGAGIAHAAHVNDLPALVIRGISDRADGAKRTADEAGWQQRACAGAAAFAAALLSHLDRVPRSDRAAASAPASAASAPAPARPRPGRSGELVGAGSEKFLVGRAREIAIFDGLLAAEAPCRLLNVYGPSGIGKSIVFGKLGAHARSSGVLVGTADISTYGDAPATILRELTGSLLADPRAAEGPLLAFAGSLDEYEAVSEIIVRGGGFDEMFDVVGAARDPAGLRAILDQAGAALPAPVRETTQNRFALERYLRTSSQRLAAEFAEALGVAMDGRDRAAILLDTYEEVRTLDVWLRRTLLPAMPAGARLVILGRNALAQQNFDWADHADVIQTWRLPELAEDEAKSYLKHYGLADPAALDHVYRVTGGYPLLLALARQLAAEVGGWAVIGHLDSSGDRDRIASQLLERILGEQRVHDVREVLEKCAVASWLNPEVIAALLDFTPEQARSVFDKVRRHSFMERHPQGVRLHEKIRALLIDRLRFTSQSEFDRLEGKLLAYHAAKAAS